MARDKNRAFSVFIKNTICSKHEASLLSIGRYLKTAFLGLCVYMSFYNLLSVINAFVLLPLNLLPTPEPETIEALTFVGVMYGIGLCSLYFASKFVIAWMLEFKYRVTLWALVIAFFIANYFIILAIIDSWHSDPIAWGATLIDIMIQGIMFVGFPYFHAHRFKVVRE
ncbi:hypothetical protein [Kordiimonas sp. SCSIO 12610]|uniref:hypothetical protein n=1 Tax=Kordiimonas sp. SCSIO 12610 TaxID=2829597 RepID=UPI00210A921F|nr:hypothetical protein [Kordiimonas sp. SCSIO 12610]UTW54917.1 hypothetical protein KFF44_14075 [Kordiimonas sp. SCSIO 12610]